MEDIKVLYIDDELDNLMAFKASYRRVFDVYTAPTAKQGYEILKNNRIEVIITDQRMPEMTGVEFFESILNVFPNPIRILLTGYTDIKAVKDAINKGQVFRYINKPWDEYELKVTIENAYQIYQLKEQNSKLQNKYQKVFTEGSDAIMLFDTSGRLIDYNKATLDLFKLKRPQLNLTLFTDLIGNKTESQQIFKTLTTKGIIKNLECKLLLNNIYKNCLLSANKINDSYGDTVTYQAILRDVTDKANLEKVLLKTVINTQETERIRISRDLHDSFGQSLVGIRFQFEALKNVIPDKQSEQVKLISDLLASTIDQLREICHNISPPSLTTFGLEKGVNQLCINYSTKLVSIHANFMNELPPLVKELEVAIYRIIQEFINNSIKHSNCTDIHIEIHHKDKHIVMQLIDNGTGFNVKSVKKGLGINNIISRIKSFDGTINMVSNKKTGTKFSIYIPTHNSIK